MKTTKKYLLLGVTALTGLGVAASFSASRTYTKSLAGECSHTKVNHHDAYAPTLTSIGKSQEYWICCDCHTAWADEAKTQVLAAGTYDLAAKTVATKITKGDVDSKDGITGLNAEKVKWTDQNDIENSPKKSSEEKMEWVSVDERNAAYFSYDFNSSSADNKTIIDLPTSDTKGNAGYTEIRFMISGVVRGASFDYKYYDLNSDTYNDGGKDPVHTMGQTYDATDKYVYQELTLTNDNQWHTAEVTFDKERDIQFFTLKIQHFTGEIYLSNLHYSHDHVYNNVTDSTVIAKTVPTCTVCGDTQDPVAYEGTGTVGYTGSLYGASATGIEGAWVQQHNGDGTRGFENGIRYATDGHADGKTVAALTLPRVCYAALECASFEVVNNSADSSIGLSADDLIRCERVTPDRDLKAYIDIVRDGNKLEVTLSVIQTTVAWRTVTIEDADVLNGNKGITFYYLPALYRNLYLSPVSLNKLCEGDRLNSKNRALETFSFVGDTVNTVDWHHFDDTAVYFYGEGKPQGTVVGPKVNFNILSCLKLQGFMNDGVRLGVNETDVVYIDGGSGNKAYFKVVFTPDYANKTVSVTTILYPSTDQEQSTFDQAPVQTVTTVVDDADVFNGKKNIELHTDFYYAWSRCLAIGVEAAPAR